jgi:hypothetical protein
MRRQRCARDAVTANGLEDFNHEWTRMDTKTKEFRHFARWLTDLALQTDKGSVLATSLIQQVREERIVLPPIRRYADTPIRSSSLVAPPLR